MENCKIELVENYPCNSKEELTAREGFYIQSNECVNKLVAGRTQRERNEIYKERNSIKQKETGSQVYRCEICDCDLKRWNKWKHNKSVKHRNNEEMKRAKEESET